MRVLWLMLLRTILVLLAAILRYTACKMCEQRLVAADAFHVDVLASTKTSDTPASTFR